MATPEGSMRRPKATSVAKEKRVFQLKVTLRGFRPPIWRRFLVPGDIRLHQLHSILQMIMGWTNSHLHQFCRGNTYYGLADPELDFECQDERRFRLQDLLRKPRDRMVYEYDFGDGWEHDVVLEEIGTSLPRARYPMVLAGRRACPPEDVGGIGGYYHFLKVIESPKHPEHRDMIEWCGGSFDPEAFDVQRINRAFHGGWGPAEAGV